LAIFRQYPCFPIELSRSFDAAKLGAINPPPALASPGVEFSALSSWERYYRIFVHPLVQEIYKFKSVMMDKVKIEWDDKFAGALRLTIFLIPDKMVPSMDDPQEDAKSAKDIVDLYGHPLRSYKRFKSPGNRIVPHTKLGGLPVYPRAHPQMKENMERCLAQVVLSDLSMSLTTHGFFPATGLLSLKIDDGVIITEEEGYNGEEFDLFTEATAETLEIRFSHFVETLTLAEHSDCLPPMNRVARNALGICSGRLPDIPISCYAMIGGTGQDFSWDNGPDEITSQDEFHVFQGFVGSWPGTFNLHCKTKYLRSKRFEKVRPARERY
jgi:hypothetical protein